MNSSGSGLLFVDQTTLNPLPAGIYVAVYPLNAAQIPANLVGSAWTQAGGFASITVQAAVAYVAVFVGTQAPHVPVVFSGMNGNITTVVVPGYRSPSLSQAGYAAEQSSRWPQGPGWFGPSARASGGIAYAIAYGIAGALSTLDLSVQSTLESLRLWSATGGFIDSWAADFLDGWFPRIAGESDASYTARIYALLSGKICTIVGIQIAAQLFYNAIAIQLAEQANQNLTFDSQGGLGSWGALDVAQGFNAIATPISVWDAQSSPRLAQVYGIVPPQFVIQIGSHPPAATLWFLDHAHLNRETFLIDVTGYTLSPAAPDPRLGALVNLVKEAGTQPMYLITTES